MSSIFDFLDKNATIFAALDSNRTFLDSIKGQSSFLKMVEGNGTPLGSIKGQSGVLKMYEGNRTFLDSIKGQSSFLKMIEGNGTLRDSIKGQSGVLRMYEGSNGVASLMSKPGFAAVIGANKILSQVIPRDRFASMIATAELPRAAWRGVFGDIRDGIGSDLYEEVVSEIDAAAEQVGEADGETWWFARLSTPRQLLLVFGVLVPVLDKASEFVSDLTGDEVPPEYRSGVQLVFVLVLALLTVLEARAESMPDEDTDD